MKVHLVTDPVELAEVDDLRTRLTLAEGAFVRALRTKEEGPEKGRAYGGSVKSGPLPTKRERLRSKEAREVDEALGQSRRRLEFVCGGRRPAYGDLVPCKEIVARWEHVIGGGHVPAADWEQRREAWGDRAEPWRGWLVDNVACEVFRDHSDGGVVRTCPRCRRPGIQMSLRTVQETLTESTRTATIQIDA